jgi:hypothetical protein
VYYRCYYCQHIGLVVTAGKWFECGSRWCGKKISVKQAKITAKVFKYHRGWSL